MDNVYKNQILYSNILSFDPVNKKRSIKKESMPADPRQGGGGTQLIESYPGYENFEDGSLEIRYFAPNAKEVKIPGFFMDDREVVLEKGEDGYFRKRLYDVPTGYYWFRFLVDGNESISPDIPISYTTGYANYVEKVEPGIDFYMMKDVPHGSITMEYYKSNITGRMRTCWVYTPPAYVKNTEKRYPVLYMNHGGGSEATSWFWQARMNFIIDNLLAEGKIEEMIVVCNSNFAYEETEDGKFMPVDAAKVLVKDCVPFVDEKYRTIADRRSRAVAGLSAGGGLSRQMAHDYPEVFANVGVFSSGAGFVISGTLQGRTFDYSELFADPEHYNNLFDVTMIAVGQQDLRIEYTKPQAEELIAKGYNIVYRDYPGGHEFKVWRNTLMDFLPLLFKKK